MKASVEEKLYEIGARPARCLLPTDEDAEQRKIWCRHYDLCLSNAAYQNWNSWTCEHCPVDDEIVDAERRMQGYDLLRSRRE